MERALGVSAYPRGRCDLGEQWYDLHRWSWSGYEALLLRFGTPGVPELLGGEVVRCARAPHSGGRKGACKRLVRIHRKGTHC